MSPAVVQQLLDHSKRLTRLRDGWLRGERERLIEFNSIAGGKIEVCLYSGDLLIGRAVGEDSDDAFAQVAQAIGLQ